MKMSFNSITKQLQNSAIEGGVLYSAIKGFKVTNHLAGKVLPAAFTGPIRSVAVALGYAVLADQFIPRKYASVFGAAAMSEVIAAFADPFIDPMLVKSDLIGMGALSFLSSVQVVNAGLPAGTAPAPLPMLGYGRLKGMGGYASMRGYSSMSNMAGYNMLGLPA